MEGATCSSCMNKHCGNEFKRILAESNHEVSLLFFLDILQHLSVVCGLAYCTNSKSGWETNLALCSKVCFACEKLRI